jgi:hypothetical protein
MCRSTSVSLRPSAQAERKATLFGKRMFALADTKWAING